MTDFAFRNPYGLAANHSTAAGITAWGYVDDTTFSAFCRPRGNLFALLQRPQSEMLQFSLNRYYFSVRIPNAQAAPCLGVHHSSEPSITFGTSPTANATAEETDLSKCMQKKWATSKNLTGWAEPAWVGNLDTIKGELSVNVTAKELDQRCGLYEAVCAALGTYAVRL